MQYVDAVPYFVIADCLRQKEVVLFVGAAASSIGHPATAATPPLPMAEDLARVLRTVADYPGAPADALTKVAEYLVGATAGRHFVLRTISDLFYDRVDDDYSSALTEFLSSLPIECIPRLIITTNYDLLIERTLEKRGIPYVAISHFNEEPHPGALVTYTSLDGRIEPPAVKKSEIDARFTSGLYADSVIVYKMHGSVHSIRRGRESFFDSIILTETDYVNFLADNFISRIPSVVMKYLGDCHLLFLGYSLQDWNFRVLLERVYRVSRAGRRVAGNKHWACLLSEDRVEKEFWQRRDVRTCAVSLDIFLEHLLREVQQGMELARGR